MWNERAEKKEAADPAPGEPRVREDDKIRLLVSSKNALFVKGIRAILCQDPSIEIVGEARDLGETVEKAIRLQPHAVLLDAVLPDLSTLDAIQHMKEAHATLKIWVLNTSGRLNSTTLFLKAGASAYLAPATRPEQLFRMIHSTDSVDREGYARAVIPSRRLCSQEARRPGVASFRFEKRRKV